MNKLRRFNRAPEYIAPGNIFYPSYYPINYIRKRKIGDILEFDVPEESFGTSTGSVGIGTSGCSGGSRVNIIKPRNEFNNIFKPIKSKASRYKNYN